MVAVLQLEHIQSVKAASLDCRRVFWTYKPGWREACLCRPEGDAPFAGGLPISTPFGTFYTPTKHFGFQGVSWYRHFVDVVWLLLFVFDYCL